MNLDANNSFVTETENSEEKVSKQLISMQDDDNGNDHSERLFQLRSYSRDEVCVFVLSIQYPLASD